MTQQQTIFLALKLALVGAFLLGVFVLAGLGKVDATAAIAAATGGVGSLVVALGISGAGASRAAATLASTGTTMPPPPMPPGDRPTMPLPAPSPLPRIRESEPPASPGGGTTIVDVPLPPKPQAKPPVKLAIMALLIGCSPGVTAVQQAEVVAYGVDEQQCVTLAATRLAADACIQQVKLRWCGRGAPLQEAGACGFGLTDAGTPSNGMVPQ